MGSPLYNTLMAFGGLVLVVVLVVAFAIAAFAHSGFLAFKEVCDKATGTTSVVATVSNDWPGTMEITSSSDQSWITTKPTAGVVNNPTVDAAVGGTYGTEDFTKVISGPVAGTTVTLTLSFKWPDGHTQSNVSKSITLVGGCTPPTPYTPTASFTSEYCDKADFQVKGSNTLTLLKHDDVEYLVEKGAQSQVYTEFSGAPPFGIGSYTVTASDSDPTGPWDVTTTVFPMTFEDASTLKCNPPDVPVTTLVQPSNSCVAVANLVIPTSSDYDYEVSVNGGPTTTLVDGSTWYATDDYTVNGVPLADTDVVDFNAIPTSLVTLTGTTHWQFTFSTPVCIVNASFTAQPAYCVSSDPGTYKGNSAEVGTDPTATAGVLYFGSVNGGAPTPLTVGSYTNAMLTAGTLLVTAQVNGGPFDVFSNGLTTMSFPLVTFVDTAKLVCATGLSFTGSTYDPRIVVGGIGLMVLVLLLSLIPWTRKHIMAPLVRPLVRFSRHLYYKVRGIEVMQ